MSPLYLQRSALRHVLLFKVLFLLSPAYCKKKKRRIATFVCVFYSDLPRDLLLKIDVGVKNIFDRAKKVKPRYFPRCYGHQRNRKTSFPSPPMPPPLTRSLHSAAAAALSLSLSLLRLLEEGRGSRRKLLLRSSKRARTPAPEEVEASQIVFGTLPIALSCSLSF